MMLRFFTHSPTRRQLRVLLASPTSSTRVQRFSTQAKKIVPDFALEKTPITATLWQQRLAQQTRAAAAAAAASASSSSSSSSSRGTPEAKCASDSVVCVLYEFERDTSLRNLFVNFYGHMRLGKLVEDVDAVAGNAAFLHAGATPYLVTACVDRMMLAKPLVPDVDMELRAFVSYTGSSSMEVRVQLSEAADRQKEPLLEAAVTYVARDRHTHKAFPVPPLLVEGERERDMFEEGRAAAMAKRELRKAQTFNRTEHGHQIRNLDDSEALRLLKWGRAKIDMPALRHRGILMAATQMTNTFICQPQHQNTAGRVFGGFLMRRAMELGFATAFSYTGSRPTFKAVDEVTFRAPVSVGDLLRVSSRVAFVDLERRYVCVEVIAKVLQPESAQANICCTVNFAFKVQEDLDPPLRPVLPTDEEEVQAMIHAKEELQLGGLM